MKPQVPPNHYHGQKYNSKARLCSFWHQVDEVCRMRPRSMLEIGHGNGFVRDVLRAEGFEATTLDIDPALRPTVAGALQAIPFRDDSFELTLCCQVLEHLPFDEVAGALMEIHRVTRRWAIVSVPDRSGFVRLQLDIPPVGSIRWLATKPPLLHRRRTHEFDGQHYWELGCAGYSLARLLDLARAAGFEVVRRYRVFEAPYHHFMVLAKSAEERTL